MSRGADRERKVARMLRAEGWAAYTTKNDGLEHGDKRFSHGIVDVVAVRPYPMPMAPGALWHTFHTTVRLIQVKSSKQGPYEHFGPDERAELIAEAKLAGASAELWWWPPYKREPQVIPSPEWPAFREEAA